MITASEERLEVTAKHPKELRPLSDLPVHIRVADHMGQPVRCEVVVAAVDEGICRLTDFQTPDPLAFFRGKRRLGRHAIRRLREPDA